MFKLERVSNSETNRYIPKEELLEYVSENDIFFLVFDEEIEEGRFYTSPLRQDATPGCWFETIRGVLKFRDFGDPSIDMPIDCFDVVGRYFKISNFNDVIKFGWEILVENSIFVKHQKKKKIISVEKPKFQILTEKRDFSKLDLEWWGNFGITLEQLKADRIFAINKIFLINTKKGNFDISVSHKNLCFSLEHDYGWNLRKIYRPDQNKYKFTTNCDNNVIGGITTLFMEEVIFITKSYKDWRVLKNEQLSGVYFQNEGMIPSVDSIIRLLMFVKTVILFFDNDDAGIKAAQKLKMIIEKNCTCKVIKIFFKKYKDPAEFIKEDSIRFKKTIKKITKKCLE